MSGQAAAGGAARGPGAGVAGGGRAPPSPEPAVADGDPHGGGLGGAVRAVGGVTLLSRLGGLARDVLVGRIFGDTAINSAFQAAFAIPNMFRRLFGEGALSAAFIPEYTRAVEGARAAGGGSDRAGEGGPDPGALASLTVLMLGVVTGAVTVVVEAVLLVLLLALPHEAERALSLRLIMVMLPFMPLICVTAILGGMLQVHGKFAASASGPLVLNGFIIAVGVVALVRGPMGETTAYALGVATVLSGATQAAWFARLLRGRVRWTRAVRAAREPARRMMRRFVPVVIGLGTLQVNAFIDTLIAMWPIWVGPTLLGFAYPLDERSNGILSLTTRLYQFPLGVFGIAVATAAFPMLARHALDGALFGRTLRRGVRLSVFIGLPASAGLAMVREDLVGVLFARGAGATGFSAEGVARSAAVLMGFAPGVWAYSLNHVLTRAFYARGDTLTPMKVAVGMVGLNLSLNVALIWWLREAGLAWSTTATAVVQCAVLAALCRRRLGAAALDGEAARALARGVGLTLAMMGVVAAARSMAGQGAGWSGAAGRLGISCAAGVAAYAAGAALLRAPELGWLLKRR
jgi:putative peptidoglycan lipid II flippase